MGLTQGTKNGLVPMLKLFILVDKRVTLNNSHSRGCWQAAQLLTDILLQSPGKVFSLDFKMLYCTGRDLPVHGHSKSVLSTSNFVKNVITPIRQLKITINKKTQVSLHTLMVTLGHIVHFPLSCSYNKNVESFNIKTFRALDSHS